MMYGSGVGLRLGEKLNGPPEAPDGLRDREGDLDDDEEPADEAILGTAKCGWLPSNGARCVEDEDALLACWSTVKR